MSEIPTPPPPNNPPPPPPGPPPAAPPASPPPAPSSGGVSQNRSIMLALSYLWLLVLIPFLAEKDDKEVQWHAKHGLVLLGAEIVLYATVWIFFKVLGFVVDFGCLFELFFMFLWIAVAALRVACIVQAVSGRRLTIPGLSEFANRF